MSEEETTLDNENSVDTGTDVDWQKRYTDTQAEYTRQQQTLKDEQAVWDDEDAILDRIRERFPELIANENPVVPEDDEVTFEDDDEVPLTKAEFQQWQAQEQQKLELAEDAKRFDADINRFAGAREVSPQGHAWLVKELTEGNIKTPKDLEKSVQSYFEWEDGLGEQYLERVKKSKRAPHIQANGQTATGTKPVEDMSREEHTAWMVEQALAREHQ